MHEFRQLLSDLLTCLDIVSCYIFMNSNCKILFNSFYRKMITVFWVMSREDIHCIKQIRMSKCKVVHNFLSVFFKIKLVMQFSKFKEDLSSASANLQAATISF